MSKHHGSNKQTHCWRGHEFTPENTISRGRKSTGYNHRECRQCMNDHKKEYRRRKRLGLPSIREEKEALTPAEPVAPPASYRPGEMRKDPKRWQRLFPN